MVEGIWGNWNRDVKMNDKYLVRTDNVNRLVMIMFVKRDARLVREEKWVVNEDTLLNPKLGL